MYGPTSRRRDGSAVPQRPLRLMALNVGFTVQGWCAIAGLMMRRETCGRPRPQVLPRVIKEATRALARYRVLLVDMTPRGAGDVPVDVVHEREVRRWAVRTEDPWRLAAQVRCMAMYVGNVLPTAACLACRVCGTAECQSQPERRFWGTP